MSEWSRSARLGSILLIFNSDLSCGCQPSAASSPWLDPSWTIHVTTFSFERKIFGALSKTFHKSYSRVTAHGEGPLCVVESNRLRLKQLRVWTWRPYRSSQNVERDCPIVAQCTAKPRSNTPIGRTCVRMHVVREPTTKTTSSLPNVQERPLRPFYPPAIYAFACWNGAEVLRWKQVICLQPRKRRTHTSNENETKVRN
jgi:hypothetical protein